MSDISNYFNTEYFFLFGGVVYELDSHLHIYIYIRVSAYGKSHKESLSKNVQGTP